MSFSGVRLGLNLLQTLDIIEREVAEFGTEQLFRGNLPLIFSCHLCPSKKFFVSLKLNWNDLTEREADILEDFEIKVWNAFMGMEERRFPSAFQVYHCQYYVRRVSRRNLFECGWTFGFGLAQNVVQSLQVDWLWICNEQGGE